MTRLDQPVDYDRRIRPDPIELLRRSGYRRNWRDDLAEMWWDIRVRPQVATMVFALGFLAGIMGVIVPCIIVALVTK